MADNYIRYLSDAKFRDLVNQLSRLMEDYRWGGHYSDFGRSGDQTDAEVDLANELDWNAAVQICEEMTREGACLFWDEVKAAEALTEYVAIQKVAVPLPANKSNRS